MAKTVARAFAEKWIVRFDCPVNLHGIMSKFFRSFCSEVGIALEECHPKYLGQYQYGWESFRHWGLWPTDHQSIA